MTKGTPPIGAAAHAPRQFVLMNPGPVTTHPAVRAALGGPDLCHREPEFGVLMERVRNKVTTVCGGDAQHTSVVLTGSGTSALEATVASVLPADGRLLVLDNGHYGERLYNIALAHGIRCHRIELGWARRIDPALFGRELDALPGLTHVAFVHHETSTGMLNDVSAVTAAARARGLETIVDAVSSVGAESLDLVRDRVDWLVGTANKCLEGMPGLSFVCASHAAFERLARYPSRSYCLDLSRHYQAQEKSQAPAFTPSVPLFYAFDVALDLAIAEGVGARGARYRKLAERLRAGLEEQGLQILLAPEDRAVGLTAVALPGSVSYDELHGALKEAGFVIYAAQETLAEGYFRLSTMGDMAEADIDVFLAALSAALSGSGAVAGTGTGRPA